MIRRITLFGLALAGVTLACDQPVTQIPTGPSAPAFNGLQLVGSSAITPGQASQFTVNIVLANGTIKAASEDTGVAWRSSNANVQVSPTGLVTPLVSQGDATITAQVRIGNTTRSVSREVIVQPPGTFRLSGLVTEEGLSSIRIPNARLEVLPNGQSTVASATGTYRLYGVPPVAEIRVSADGYETRTFSLQVSGNISQTFALPFDGVRPSLSGNYALFFESVTCAPSAFALPAELRQRVWDAEIVQNGSQLKIKLSGAPFRIESGLGDNFTGVVLAGGAQFFLQSYVQYFYYGLISTFYPSVAERLPDNRYLVPQGDNVILTGSAASGLSGTFNGSLALWDANFPEFSSRQVHGCSGQTSMRFVPR